MAEWLGGSSESTTPAQRRTLVAAGLGWMLDAFDVMLYAVVLASVSRDLHMTKAAAGMLNTLTLIASGIGGLGFGFIADRIGRARALMLAILTYSVCSFASGLATSVLMLAVFRFILGLGMGGEWNTGATLVAETWPAGLRARALAVVQSSWAIGYALAVVVGWVCVSVLHWDWRRVFFAGVLPALVTLWMLKAVPESEMWRNRLKPAGKEAQAGVSDLLFGKYARHTLALLLMILFGMFGWWGLFTWLPTFLQAPAAEGGRGFDRNTMTWMLVIINLGGMFPGYLSYGWIADRIGRRKSVMLYTAMAALLVPLYAMAHDARTLTLLGMPVAFFGTGFFSASGLIGSEIFPTEVRARALGLTYNGARMLSAAAPFTIGRVADSRGLSWAFGLCAVSFLLSAVAAGLLPETQGKPLE
ncbi:MAG: MFS transporter [Acidobacteria bacterium]|nr:MFS transporter [Acidobacteriota bacterium]